MNSICSLLLTAAVALFAIPAEAGPVMTFEEFSDGATNVDGFYGSGVTWLNEEVFNSAGTPAQSPYTGPNPNQANVLTRISCTGCELELTSVSAIATITLSGLITSGSLQMLAFSALNVQIGSGFVVDTDLQSVGCSIVTDWSCNRSFDFTMFNDIHRLQFITSGDGLLDNVQVTTYAGTGGQLPEPDTLLLAAAALLGIAATRRRETSRPTFLES